MLTWKIARRHPVTKYHADLAESGDDATHAALVELWSKVLDELAGIRPDVWEILVCYIAPESGDVLVYPATAANPNNSPDVPDVSLMLADWIEAFEEIEDLEGEEFERATDRLEERYDRQLREAIEDPRVAPRFQELRERPKFAVFSVDAVEEVYPASLRFLWGSKPPRGIPSGSAREMFEFLLCKAQTPPDAGNVMKLEGGRVVQVTFFGAEFNDKSVDLIEQVPNVQELCKDLRELVLQDTRIKPPAVERLRRLLPNARVEVRVYSPE